MRRGQRRRAKHRRAPLDIRPGNDMDGFAVALFGGGLEPEKVEGVHDTAG